MKKSEVIKILTQFDTATEADELLKALEEAGLINPRYLVPDGHGMFDIKYGWEPEDERT